MNNLHHLQLANEARALIMALGKAQQHANGPEQYARWHRLFRLEGRARRRWMRRYNAYLKAQEES